MEKYSTFPKGTKQGDVFEMLLDGEMKCVCYNCNAIINVTEEMGTVVFKCPKCIREQMVASMNPKYLDINCELLEA